MTKQELINAVAPTVQHLFGDTAENVRKGLERMSTPELEKMYQNIRVPEHISPAAKQQVDNSPEALALARENQRLRQQMAQEQGFAIIFNTPVPEAGGKIAKDCEANRETIKQWVLAEPNPNVVNNTKVWWLGIFKQNIALANEPYGPIVWEPLPKSKAEQQAQNNEQFRKDAETFYDFARSTRRVSASHANFLLVHRTLGPGLSFPQLSSGITDLPTGPTLVLEDGQEIELSPPSRSELAKWQAELFEEDQQNLKDMRGRYTEADKAALQQRTNQDHVRNTKNLKQLEFEFSVLKSYEIEQGLHQFPQLPEQWHGQTLDASFIKNASATDLRELLKRFGRCQVDARLNNLPADFFNNYQAKLYQTEKAIQNLTGVRQGSY